MPNPRALSVRALAARWAIAPAKVRDLIRRGIVRAIDVGFGGRKQLRITPEAVQEAEAALAVRKPAQRAKRRQAIDEEIERLLA